MREEEEGEEKGEQGCWIVQREAVEYMKVKACFMLHMAMDATACTCLK